MIRASVQLCSVRSAVEVGLQTAESSLQLDLMAAAKYRLQQVTHIGYCIVQNTESKELVSLDS